MSAPDKYAWWNRPRVTLKSAYVEARPGMVTRTPRGWALITRVLQHDVSCTVTLYFANGDRILTFPGDSLTIMHPVAADEWLAAQSDVR